MSNLIKSKRHSHSKANSNSSQKAYSNQFQNILNQFQEALLHPPANILSELHSSPNINSEKRFNIYQYAYQARLIEILASDYPKLKMLFDTELGKDAFQTMAEAYLAKYPSRYPNVYYFSQHLAQFLGESSQYKAHTYLKEMADFEWIMGEVQHAADIKPLEPNALLSVPGEKFGEIKLKFTDSMQLLSYHWNVPKIWGILEHQDNSSDTSEETNHEIAEIKNNDIDQNAKNGTDHKNNHNSKDEKNGKNNHNSKHEKSDKKTQNHISRMYPDLNYNADAEDWLMYRQERQIFYRSISPVEALTIKLMQNHASFSELCEALCEHMEEDKVPAFAISHLQQWLAWGQVSIFY